MAKFGKLLLAVAAMAVAAPTPAGAVILKFALTGDVTVTWRLPASPVPDVSDGSSFFAIGFYPVTTTTGRQRANMFFSTPANGYALSLQWTGTNFVGSGEQLFTGSVEFPIFRTGTFTLTRFSPTVPGDGTLTISAVPEPASWALLVPGFGLAGAVARRRRAVRPA